MNYTLMVVVVIPWRDTMVVLEITGAGQPALLYLVPFILGTSLTAGFCRNELASLWHGTPLAEEDGEPLMIRHTASC